MRFELELGGVAVCRQHDTTTQRWCVLHPTSSRLCSRRRRTSNDETIDVTAQLFLRGDIEKQQRQHLHRKKRRKAAEQEAETTQNTQANTNDPWSAARRCCLEQWLDTPMDDGPTIIKRWRRKLQERKAQLLRINEKQKESRRLLGQGSALRKLANRLLGAQL